MKLVRIKAKGFPLFTEELVIDFFAEQRINQNTQDSLYTISKQISLQNVMAFIGINAAGKTTVLKIIAFVIEMLNNVPINSTSTNDILRGSSLTDSITFETYFLQEEAIHKLVTVIKSKEADEKGEPQYYIASEKLWKKPIKQVTSKKNICEFSEKNSYSVRKGDEEYLMEDVSIMIAPNNKSKERISMLDLRYMTDFNFLLQNEIIPISIIEYLDPSIEYLKIEKADKNQVIKLKFKKSQEIILHEKVEINEYLSSGTIKGISVFLSAYKIFLTGGYLIVDELENHFNTEIVTKLITFFMDSKMNKNGGTLIFSTHYSEILDSFERNDAINIVRHKNGITIQKLSHILTRNDLKKSEAYQSGYLKGTTPVYEFYMNLKRAFINGTMNG